MKHFVGPAIVEDPIVKEELRLSSKKKFIKVDDLCTRFGVSRTWVYKQPNSVLPRIKFNGRTLRPLQFDLTLVEELFSSDAKRSLKTKEVGQLVNFPAKPLKEVIWP
jgi:hypothetical protein